MPLDAEDESLAGHLDALGNPVVRTRREHKAPAKPIDAAMVGGVHGISFFFPASSIQKGTLLDDHVVTPRFHEVDVVPLVRPGDSRHAGDVHGERSPKGDVQRLRPSTNGKQGLIGLYRSLQKHHFEGVALGAECAARVVAVITPQLRGHIRSARQADTIRPIDILADQGLILGKVHHDGQAACLEKGVDIALGCRLVLGKLTPWRRSGNRR